MYMKYIILGYIYVFITLLVSNVGLFHFLALKIDMYSYWLIIRKKEKCIIEIVKFKKVFLNIFKGGSGQQ